MQYYLALLAKDTYINQIFVDKKLFKNFDDNLFQQNILKLLKECKGFSEDKQVEAADYIASYYLNRKSLFGKQKSSNDFYLEKYTQVFLYDILLNDNLQMILIKLNF